MTIATHAPVAVRRRVSKKPRRNNPMGVKFSDAELDSIERVAEQLGLAVEDSFAAKIRSIVSFANRTMFGVVNN